jgi:RNase P/RNase MRP subunit p30
VQKGEGANNSLEGVPVHDIVMKQELVDSCLKAGFDKVFVIGKNSEIIRAPSLQKLKQTLTKIKDGKVIFSQGGEIKANRIGVRDTRIDFLLDPVLIGRGMDPQVVNVAKENDVGFAFSLSSLLSCSGMRRAALIGRIMDTIKIAVHKKVKIMIGSFASSTYHLRTPYDLSQLFSILGLTYQQARAGMELIE